MASLEIDPGYIKCLRLLHSKSKDSEEQLRQMLEDLIRQRNGNTKSIALLQKRDVSSSKKEKHSIGSNGRKEDSKKEAEKHSYDDSAVSSRESSKKIKIESSKSSHTKSSSTPTSPLSPAKSFMSDMEIKEDLKEEDDHDDLALEILEEDLTCVVCHGMDVGVRNQLVECLECHSLYHQECHNPPVPDDMNEPRSVWYCGNCTKVLKKMPSSSRSSPKLTSGNSSNRDRDSSPAATVTTSTTNVTSSHTSSSSISSTSTAKSSKSESSQSQNPFKRSEKILPRQSKPSSQQYSRSQPQNKQHQLQKLRKMLSPRSPSVGSDKN